MNSRTLVAGPVRAEKETRTSGHRMLLPGDIGHRVEPRKISGGSKKESLEVNNRWRCERSAAMVGQKCKPVDGGSRPELHLKWRLRTKKGAFGGLN